MRTKTHMLATDLDHTLVGSPAGVRELTALLGQQSGGTALVYVTGRHTGSVRELIRQENLPLPDIVISDVGTAIWHMPGWQEDAVWRKHMEVNWQPDRIKACAAQFPALRLQPLPDDRRVSFTVDQDPESVRRFRECLVAMHIPHRFIYSSNRDVDVLPERAGKGSALDYVIDTYASPGVRLLVAGDSGNDIDMLDRNWPAVIVGNGHSDLKAIPDRPNLYRAKRHCAGGICEAWRHFYGRPQPSAKELKKLSGKS